MPPPRILIIGGGFGGLHAARALRRSKAEITLLDRENHHLFQPLLYQVATAALSPGNIATPLRTVFERQKNCSVFLADVEHIDLERKRVTTRSGTHSDYDYLVIAAGVRTAYFHHDEWADRAPGLKTIDDAVAIRRRYLLAFEQAEMETDPDARRRALTFAIVGAGPTGVEMAGAMAELARQTMRKSFRRLDTREARVILIDGLDRVLSTFPAELAEHAARDLQQFGVELRLDERVVEVAEGALTLESGTTGQRSTIETTNIIWAAGVEGCPLARSLGTELDHLGRVRVEPDLSIPGHPEAFVVGDLSSLTDPASGKPVPGVAQAAMQGGRHAGRIIARELAATGTPTDTPAPRPPFRYRNKGELATIGRARAVANLGKLRMTGYPAWVLWATVHIAYLIGFRSKFLTLLEWAWLYFFYDRGVRLITGRDRSPNP